MKYSILLFSLLVVAACGPNEPESKNASTNSATNSANNAEVTDCADTEPRCPAGQACLTQKGYSSDGADVVLSETCRDLPASDECAGFENDCACFMDRMKSLGCGQGDGEVCGFDDAGSVTSATCFEDPDEGCTFDADCAAGEACEYATCVQTCEVEADCADGEVCAPGDQTALDICRTETVNNTTNNSTNNSTNNATNSATNNATNNASGDGVYFAGIFDVSSGPDACDTFGDPGSDIFAVGLEDATGASLGWGNVVADGIVLADNDYGSTAHLDGTELDAVDVCPEFDQSTITALGCDGWLIVEFLDGSGERLELDSSAGQVIRVYEYGAQCTTGSAADTYDVYLCDDATDVLRNSPTSCTINLLISASGEQTANVIGF